jgi:type IV pilus assembly protein PilE
MPSSTAAPILHARPVSAGLQACVDAGFTLVDLVAALAIAALLACVAVPSYRAELARTRRADARAALLALAAAEESFYTTCNAYAAVLDDSAESSCEASRLRFPGSAGQGAYSLEVTAADTSTWTALATALAGGPQQADARCRALGLTSTGDRTARTADGAANHTECWTR